jgi:anti-sigma B factor antagonist
MSDAWMSRVEGDLLSIVLRGPRLDAKAATSLKSGLSLEVPPSINRAEVDMDGINFLDSSGVGILLSIHRKLPAEGAEVTLRNVDPAVRSTLELLRLHRVFNLA